MPRKGWVVLAVCLAVAVAAPCSGQLPAGLPIPPINFATLHPFGSSGIVDIRHMALGNAHVADDRDGWHGNPAGMIALDRPAIEVHNTWYPFTTIPDVNRFAVGYGFRVGKADVIKILGAWADAHGTVSGFAAPVHVSGTERDFSIEYAHRVNSKLTLGVATAYLGTDSNYTVAGLGSVTQLKSKPYTAGGRIGAIYRVCPKVNVGFTYDNYQEGVDRYASAFKLTPTSTTFHSTAWHYGVAYWPDELTSVMIDYQDVKLAGAGSSIIQRALMGGVERRVGNLFVRFGMFEGSATGGVGARVGGWDISYAFSGKSSRDIADRGGKTAHAVQIRHYF